MPFARAASNPPPSRASESLPRTIATRPSGHVVPDAGSTSGESGSWGWAFVTNGIATVRTAASATTALIIGKSIMEPAGARNASPTHDVFAPPRAQGSILTSVVRPDHLGQADCS